MSAIALGTNFGEITDIATGSDGLLYILTLDVRSNGEGNIYRIHLSHENNDCFFLNYYYFFLSSFNNVLKQSNSC
jgi:hypothetical protein